MAFYSNALDFPNLTSKGTPTTSDIILIADVAAANAPKQATVGSLPFPTVPVSVTNGGTGVATLTTPYGVLTAGTTATGNVQTLAALGASGTVLTSNGASALPSFQAVAASASGLTFIASVTASNSATVNFSNNLSSTYDNYVVIFENAFPSAGGTGVQLRMRVGTTATPTYQTSGYIGTNLDINPSNTSAASSGTASFLLNNIATSVTSTIVSGGMVLINNANNASNAKNLTSSISTATSTGTYQLSISGGAWNSSAVLTSLQFSYVSGNVSTGTFKLYGYQNS